MDLQWLWQSLFARITWAILAIGGGAVLGWAKKRGFGWTEPIRYGIAGVAIIAFCLVGLRFLLAPPSPVAELTTTENVESHVRAWIDDFGFTVRRVTDPNAFWAFEVTLRSGTPIVISRNRARDRYLQLQVILTPSPDHRTAINNLSAIQQAQLVDELALELARSKIGYTIGVDNGNRFATVIINKAVPVGSLSVDLFAVLCDEMDSDASLAREAIRLFLARIIQPGQVRRQ